MPAAAVDGDACRVHVCAEEDAARWERFVMAAPQASFFHRIGWREVLERSLGHRTHYLCAETNGVIGGVLPLAEVKSRIFGHALISLPFCVYGGIVAHDDRHRDVLLQAACALAERLGVDYLELRNRVPLPTAWPTKNLYVTFRKAIDADEETNYLAIPRKQRAMVRMGIDAGLTEADVDGVDRLYRAYAESVRNLGTPVFAKRYLKHLRRVFGDDCEVLTVNLQGQPVASVMSFYFRDEVLPYYGGGVAAAREVKANDYLYWALMRRAAARGARLFDYGRSKVDSGSYRFKKHWGFEPEPLHYQYYLVRAQAMPNLSPTNPRYQRLIALWKRLPLPVTQLLGPPIARYLG